MDTFWRTQQPAQPLFPDVEWNRPERRDLAGKLAIVGGNKLGFAAVATAYQTARDTGAGSIRVLLPHDLKKGIPPQMTDVLFAPTTPSGGLSAQAAPDLQAIGAWADVVLLAGDAGKNSQTAALYEAFIDSATIPIVIMRDAIDVVQHSLSTIVNQPNVVLITSFAQLQKLFRAVYYPKVLTFRMQLAQCVDALHKFTITYPLTVMVLHADHLIIARGGEVVTQAWNEPMRLWRGETGARVASYLLWSPEAPLAACAAAIA